MFESPKELDSIGGADADRTRDLLNAICGWSILPVSIGITW
jgi:hypothetical protein